MVTNVVLPLPAEPYTTTLPAAESGTVSSALTLVHRVVVLADHRIQHARLRRAAAVLGVELVGEEHLGNRLEPERSAP